MNRLEYAWRNVLDALTINPFVFPEQRLSPIAE